MRAFWENGYESTSISDLTRVMGLNPPSLYAAFGDKQQLFLEAVERYQDCYAAFVKRALDEEPTAHRAIRRLFEEATVTFTDPATPPGCMVVTSAVHCTGASEAVFSALARKRAISQAVLQDRLELGRRAGEFDASVDLQALAGFLATLFQGLSLQARDGATAAQLRAIVDLALKALPEERALKA